jgi:hypothetical protein
MTDVSSNFKLATAKIIKKEVEKKVHIGKHRTNFLTQSELKNFTLSQNYYLA